jgi:hypothetical protein
MNFRKRTRLLLLAALALGMAGGNAIAQQQPEVTSLEGGPPASVIYIGNSFFYYNNGIHRIVTGLRRGATPPLTAPMRSTLATLSGSGLDWHDVGSYFRPNAIGRYSFIPGNRVRFNTERIGPLFEVAVMMDCSLCPVHPELGAVFVEYARRHAETVRAHGGKPVLFMSWAYSDAPAMTAQLAEAYTRAGNANNALVIPAGLAFARSIAQRPDLNLYMADLRHPSAAGSYLAAATTFATLFGRSPEGNSFTDTLDAGTAGFLQRVAWEAVRAYHGPLPTAPN